MIADSYDAQALTRELAQVSTLLGDTRVRFRHRQTRAGVETRLIGLDREIRPALVKPPSAALLSEVRALTAHLRALDPH